MEADLRPERWQQIESIFQAALELDPRNRAEFFDQSCGSDPELRKEVELLISFHEKEGTLVEPIALSEGLRAIAAAQPGELAVGQTFGSYEIIARLGEGGMAEVYLARDTRLGRSVALKTLQADIARDESAMQRFRQEARAASALNHPNIVTIHEIVQIDEVHVIATEFIDGETLRSRISKTSLKLTEALDVADQVASALSAAHRAGIIHRDIKPENIMLRSDGYVKVLDFGLAKLARSHPHFEDFLRSAGALSTQPGIILGTISYMSPEQARGLDMDARTDIWSLGVVLYEMILGKAPFEGETATDVIVSILEREPAIPSPHENEIPAELAHIIGKCLAKDRGERYQTIDELLAEIRPLKRQIEIEDHLKGDTPSAFTTNQSAGSARKGRALPDTRKLTAITRAASVINHKVLSTVSVMAILLAIGVALSAIYTPLGRKLFDNGAPSHFVAEPVSRLTTDGKVRYAAVSPDGKYLAFVNDDMQRQSLVVRQVDNSAYNEIIAPSPFKYRGLTFSPNSNDVYYVVAENEKDGRKLYRVSILGGSPRKISDNVDSPVTFSPDGKRFSFVRDNPGAKESALVIAQTESGEERVLATRKEPNHFSIYGPAWSPDGTVIALSAHNADSRGTYMSVVEIRESDGSQRTITSARWLWIEQVAWHKDGRRLIISGKENSSTPYRLYEIGYPEGQTVRVTNDLGDYHGISFTSDGEYLTSVQREEVTTTWVASAKDNFKRAVQVARARGRFYPGISWTRAGDIVYTSTESGNADIWLMDADGKKQRQLTIDEHTEFFPVVSPDGQYVVFVSNRAGSSNLWRMDLDGSHVVQLTYGAGEYVPQCSRMGRLHFFRRHRRVVESAARRRRSCEARARQLNIRGCFA